MPIKFDFGKYASTYSGRPEYVTTVIDAVVRVAGVGFGDIACDIGAGSGHLTQPLLDRGLLVDAVEPNDAMRVLGQRRTADYSSVSWHTGVGEDTGRPAGRYALVSYGGSFDHTDRGVALREAARLLRAGGHFVCLWNHRELDDPLQARIEELIKSHVPDFRYGVRRSEQGTVIEESGLFEGPVRISGRTVYDLDAEAWCDLWRSHWTLGEQAGGRFETVLREIRELVRTEAGARVSVPYETVAWVARRRGEDRP
ncbi:class I SAM-dependent methyltransferase [Actinosynnema sp. NPDC002837]